MTNNNNLPDIVVNALSSNEYVGGEGYSATTLLKPAQMVMLQKRYGDDERDVLDNLWSMFGTAVHNYFERYAEPDAIVEQRIRFDIDGVKISGQIDHYKNGTISDYKITSAWKAVSGDFSDWEKQLNIYAYLATAEGMHVDKLQIIAVFKDWSKMQALRGNDYPDAPIKVISIPLWKVEEQEDFIDMQIGQLEYAKDLNDDKLPQCTDKERWYTGTKYAVMKKGNKRAVKLFESVHNAHEYALKDPKYYVEERIGENKRCDQYCPVASKCQQYKEILNG